jgi:hypothetical protein
MKHDYSPWLDAFVFGLMDQVKELRTECDTLLTEQAKDLADVNRFRDMARKYMDERDDLQFKLGLAIEALQTLRRRNTINFVDGRVERSDDGYTANDALEKIGEKE